MSTGEAHVAFCGKTKYELEQMVSGMIRVRRTNSDGVADMFFPRELLMKFARDHVTARFAMALLDVMR